MIGNSAKYWIEKLQLLPHPEGGFYKETYRSEEELAETLLPNRYEGARNFQTGIYFLILSDNPSHFHRLSSDELWFFHTGSPIRIHLLMPDGRYQTILLDGKSNWQAILLKGTWFAAEVVENNSFGLISCTVAPGFDFRDFEMAKAEELVISYPEHEVIIRRLCL
jgi:predicted cupin superfamily sugar epimerase